MEKKNVPIIVRRPHKSAFARAASTTTWKMSVTPHVTTPSSRCSETFHSAIISRKKPSTSPGSSLLKELKLPKDQPLRLRFRKGRRSGRDLAQARRRSERSHLPFRRKGQLLVHGRHRPLRPLYRDFYRSRRTLQLRKVNLRHGLRLRPLYGILEPGVHAVRARRDGNLNPLPKPSVDTGAGWSDWPRLFRKSTPTTISMRFDKSSPESNGSPAKNMILCTRKQTRRPFFQRDRRPFARDGVLDGGRGFAFERRARLCSSPDHAQSDPSRQEIRIHGPFLHKTAGFVIDQMKSAYPDLINKRAVHRESSPCRRRAVSPNLRKRVNPSG